MKIRIKFILLFLIISLIIKHSVTESNLNNINNIEIENINNNNIINKDNSNNKIINNIEKPKTKEEQDKLTSIAATTITSTTSDYNKEINAPIIDRSQEEQEEGLLILNDNNKNEKRIKQNKNINFNNSNNNNKSNNDNELSEKTKEQKTLAVDILYFEIGILVVFVFSIYFIRERKKQILNQNNEKLSKYLNKV